MTLEERKERAELEAARARDELRVAVQELSSAARRQLDLTEHVRARPWSWLAGAAAIGLWLGSRH